MTRSKASVSKTTPKKKVANKVLYAATKDDDLREMNFDNYPLPPFNMSHEDVAHRIEFAFEVAGKKFYRFKKEFSIPAGRYKWYYAYLRRIDLKMSPEMLNQYVDEIVKTLNGGKKGEINLVRAIELLLNLKTRTQIGFEPEAVKFLSAVAYFDETEDLSGFDQEYGNKKIAFWDKHKCLDFFLTRPIGDLLNLNNISKESLQAYIDERMEIIQILNSELYPQSSESTLSNGKKSS